MILGTVELGLDYGINNREGKPSIKQAFDLLDTAWVGGIRELDTAAAYGDSEYIIGQYQKETGNLFHIDTKLPVEVSENEYLNSFNASCDKLGINRINLLYLHSFEQCKSASMINFLSFLKESGRIAHIGISIYEPSEMLYIMEKLPVVDTIQFPYNLLDSYRWKKDGLLHNAFDMNKRLYVRSVFLQGLVFKNPEDVFAKAIGASHYLAKIRELGDKAEMSIAQLAYKYVSGTKELKEIIIGCQKKEEVISNLSLEMTTTDIPLKIREELDVFTKDIPVEVIDPRKWKR